MKKINKLFSALIIAGLFVTSCQKSAQQNQESQEETTANEVKTEDISTENTPKVEVKEDNTKQNKAQNTPKIGLEIGDTAPDFGLPDPKGTFVTLSQFRGKTTLIDFWAAWCGPCRRENPNVVAVYQKYKDKGFQVLGVSLDNDKQKWTEAITKDNLTWTQISDLKHFDSAVVPLYQVEGIPTNFLIDKNGIILAKNLRGVELALAVEKAFK